MHLLSLLRSSSGNHIKTQVAPSLLSHDHATGPRELRWLNHVQYTAVYDKIFTIRVVLPLFPSHLALSRLHGQAKVRLYSFVSLGLLWEVRSSSTFGRVSSSTCIRSVICRSIGRSQSSITSFPSCLSLCLSHSLHRRDQLSSNNPPACQPGCTSLAMRHCVV